MSPPYRILLLVCASCHATPRAVDRCTAIAHGDATAWPTLTAGWAHCAASWQRPLDELAHTLAVDRGGLARVLAGAAPAEVSVEIAVAVARLEHPRDPVVHWIPEASKDALSFSVSPDGRTFTADGSMVRAVLTGLPIARVTHAVAPAVVLDGRRLAIATRGDVEIRTPHELIAHFAAVGMLAAGPGDRLAIAGDTLRVVSVARGHEGQAIAESPGQPCRAIAWRGPTIACATSGAIALWRLEGNRLARVTTTATGHALAIRNDGGLVAVAGPDTPLVLIDARTGAIAKSFDLHPSELAFAGDTLHAVVADSFAATAIGRDLVPVDEELTDVPTGWQGSGDVIVSPAAVLAWTDHVETGTWFPQPAPGPPVAALAWSATGDTLAVATDHEIMELSPAGMKIATGELLHGALALHYRPGHDELWWEGSYNNEGVEHIALMARPRQGSPRLIATWPHSRDFAFTLDGARWIGQQEENDDLQVRRVDDGQLAQAVHVDRELHNAFTITFAGDDHLLVAGEPGRTIVWNTRLKVTVWSFGEEPCAVSADGRWLVTERGLTLVAYDLARQHEVHTISDALGAICRFSPDGSRLAIGTMAGAIVLYDTASWSVTTTIAAHERELRALAWRPDGKLLASGSEGGVVKLWDAAGTPRVTIAPGERAAWIAMFPDGSSFGSTEGREHVDTRVGDVPIGPGVPSPAATETRWGELFH